VAGYRKALTVQPDLQRPPLPLWAPIVPNSAS
jgi:hypothetical protein